MQYAAKKKRQQKSISNDKFDIGYLTLDIGILFGDDGHRHEKTNTGPQVASIALNSSTTANDNAEEAVAYREYFSHKQFAYATA